MPETNEILNLEKEAKRKGIIDSEYQDLLSKHNIAFLQDGKYYLVVGKPANEHGWKIHMTVNPLQADDLLEKLLPVIKRYNIPFRIIKNSRYLENLNSGNYGKYKVGKFVTLYIDNSSVVDGFLTDVLKFSSTFLGPKIFTDFFIKDNIYVRYGSFNSRALPDTYENLIRIFEMDGKYMFDYYYEPPIAPDNVENPFLQFAAKAPVGVTHNKIGKKYIPSQLLKTDLKGDVWLGFYASKFKLPKKCVIKQGRHGLFPDDLGRDITQRLEWQYKIGKKLDALIPMPKIIDFVKEDGNCNLIMEYKEGYENLADYISNQIQNSPWFLLTADTQITVLRSLLQVVKIIRTLHENGYIHRDITGGNFLVDKKGAVSAIDLELLYDSKNEEPNPPFGVGTAGFLSPEQANEEDPTLSDDLYSLGALLLMSTLSGIEPKLISKSDKRIFVENITFFIRNSKIIGLITDCFFEYRKQITVQEFQDRLSGIIESITSGAKIDKDYSESSEYPPGFIDKCIAGLAGSQVTIEKKWFSRIENDFGIDVYPHVNKHFFSGLYRGTGGVLWLLLKARNLGYSIESNSEAIEAGLQFLTDGCLSNLEGLNSSYYYGKAGLGVLISEGMKTGFLIDNTDNRSLILKCFDYSSDSHNMYYGIAGQGIALLYCREHLPQEFVSAQIDAYATELCSRQDNQGYWEETTEEGVKVNNGFGYGVAGIVYFLIEYIKIGGSIDVHDNILKGLDYLESVAIKSNDKLQWAEGKGDKTPSIWFCSGTAGIGMTFLHASEVLQDERYGRIGEMALLSIHPNLVFQKLSTCHGLAGLGEAYLEAYRITGNMIWKEKAKWIVDVIAHLKRPGDEDAFIWICEKSDFPTADLMVGNSGLVHLLLRYADPQNVKLPLMP